jgi:AcrR family transcriptional regulator
MNSGRVPYRQGMVDEDPLKQKNGDRGEEKRRVRRNRMPDVIDAGIDVFWHKGYTAASMQDVADVVGVTKGSVYHYIDSKEDLLFRIFDEAHREAEQLMTEVNGMNGSPLTRLRIYLERHVEQFLQRPERTSLYFRDWRYLTEKRHETVVEQRRAYESFVRGLISEAQSDGELDPTLNVRYAALFIVGAINYVAEWFRRDGRDSAAIIAKTHAAMAIQAIAGGNVQPGEPDVSAFVER